MASLSPYTLKMCSRYCIPLHYRVQYTQQCVYLTDNMPSKSSLAVTSDLNILNGSINCGQTVYREVKAAKVLKQCSLFPKHSSLLLVLDQQGLISVRLLHSHTPSKMQLKQSVHQLFSLSLFLHRKTEAHSRSVVGAEMRLLFETLLRVTILLPLLLVFIIIIFTVRLIIKADGCLNREVPQ